MKTNVTTQNRSKKPRSKMAKELQNVTKEIELKRNVMDELVSEETKERLVKYSTIAGLITLGLTLSPLLIKVIEWNVKAFKGLGKVLKSK